MRAEVIGQAYWVADKLPSQALPRLQDKLRKAMAEVPPSRQDIQITGQITGPLSASQIKVLEYLDGKGDVSGGDISAFKAGLRPRQWRSAVGNLVKREYVERVAEPRAGSTIQYQAAQYRITPAGKRELARITSETMAMISDGKIGDLIDELLMLCYRAFTSKYGKLVFRSMQVLATLLVLGYAVFLITDLRQERNRHPANTGAQADPSVEDDTQEKDE